MSEVPDSRGIADRGLATAAAIAALPPAPVVRSAEQVDDWFRAARTLYWQGVRSGYSKSMLASYGGVLALASLDAEDIRYVSRDDGWVIDSRNFGRESKETWARWSVREQIMRKAIAAGAPPDTAIREYINRLTKTEPESLPLLKAMTGEVAYASDTRWAWQDELETIKQLTRSLLSAPHDMPVGFTVVAAATALDPPETPGEVADRLKAAAVVETSLGVAAGVYSGRGAGSAEFVSTVPTVSPAPAYVSAPPSERGVFAPPAEAAKALDVRGVGAGGWTGRVDDRGRGLVVDETPAPAAAGAARLPDELPPSAPPPSAPPPTAGGAPPAPVERVRFVDGRAVFDDPLLGLIYEPGPTVISLKPPWDTKYKFNKTGNLLALWDSRWKRVLPPLSKSAREQNGYSNSQLTKTWREDLRDHWEERGLARQRADGSWEMFDIELKQWFPQSEIDMGHIVAAVEHHQMLKEALKDEFARDPVAAEAKRIRLVWTFMHDFTNYVPQQSDRNQKLGRGIGLTYEGNYPDFEYGPSGRVDAMGVAPTAE